MTLLCKNLPEKNLLALREKVDKLDRQILEILKARQEEVEKIAKVKQELLLDAHQPDREKFILQQREAWARELGLSADFIQKLFLSILKESVRIQQEK
jgi:chorismate mutase